MTMRARATLFFLGLAALVAAALPSSAADFKILQLDRFDGLHNGSIDVDSGIGHNLRPDGPIICNLLLEGPIQRGDRDRLQAVIGRQRETAFDSVPRLCLNSPGGSYSEGLALARYLMENNIGTAVRPGGECYSACAIIFMGGTYPWKGEINRYLHTRGVLGFHAPYIPDSNAKNTVMVDEKLVRTAFSEGIGAITAFMRLGVGNQVKRIVPELMQEMLAQGPDEFFFVDTVGKAIRFRIHLYGIEATPQIDAGGVCNACVNMNYGAYERYGRGGEADLCKRPDVLERRSFPGGVRLTNEVAPRGGSCAVDVVSKNGKLTGWMYRNDEQSAFGDGLELAFWYLLSPSTRLAKLTKAAGLDRTSDTGGLPQETDKDRLLRELFNFVVVEYLGHGREDHRDRPELFAPRVNYYKRGVISRDVLLADKATYYKRWPQRRYELIKDTLRADPGRNDTLDITFRYNFEVANGPEVRRGIGVAKLGVALVDGRFAIVSEDGSVERRQ